MYDLLTYSTRAYYVSEEYTNSCDKTHNHDQDQKLQLSDS